MKHLNSTVPRPSQELKGFKRVALQAGEQETVQIPLPAPSLAYWNTAKHTFEVEPDKIQIRAGGSSAGIQVAEVVQVN